MDRMHPLTIERSLAEGFIAPGSIVVIMDSVQTAVGRSRCIRVETAVPEAATAPENELRGVEPVEVG